MPGPPTPAQKKAAEVAGPLVPAKWSDIKWNPPMHRAALGAYVGDANGDRNFNRSDRIGTDPYRNEVMGADSPQERRWRKGVIFQHLAFPKEWTYSAGREARGSYAAGSARDGNRYGFRFHYNPSTIDYGMGINEGGVNPAFIMSGKSTSMPITTNNMPTIRFQFFLNRIEDMMLLAPKQTVAAQSEVAYIQAYNRWLKDVEEAERAKDLRRLRDLRSSRPTRSQYKTSVQPVIPKAEEMGYFYGKALSPDDIEGIYQRGTGYDLEYLFRVMLGKPWSSLLRGDTADVGIAFGVPMILDLNAGATATNPVRHGQRYLGRVSAISYTHLSFNRRMVPMWTQVAIDFIRYPDVTGAAAGSVERVQDAVDAAWNETTAKAAMDAGLTSPSLSGGTTTPTTYDNSVYAPGGSVYNSQVPTAPPNPVLDPYNPWPGVFGPEYNDPWG